MITVKRNCSSSVRTTSDKISFGDFTIIFDEAAFETYSELKRKYQDVSDVEFLETILFSGLLSLSEEGI